LIRPHRSTQKSVAQKLRLRRTFLPTH